jgi:mRNA interferase MazF
MKTIRLPKLSWVKISQIRTLSTERLAKKIGLISPEELTDIVDGLFELVH